MITNNDVTIRFPLLNINNIVYINNSFVITEGQAHGHLPPSISYQGNQWTISVGADRQNSALVAQQFNEVTGGLINPTSSHTYSPWASEDFVPAELNFFFGVNLIFGDPPNTVTVPIYLGQGHMVTSNNWWIGGTNILSTGPGFALCTLTVANVVLEVTQFGENYHFQILQYVPPAEGLRILAG